VFSKNNKKNILYRYFLKNEGHLIHKWLHYFEIYERHFSGFRGKNVTILEFGVSHGGSLQMWKKYFGKKARIIGVDVDNRCKKLEEKQIEIYIGDQEDRQFLANLMKKIGKVDIVIEDGGHQMAQQIATFEEVYPHIVEEGVFLIEDVHTSYWARYDAGYKKEGTFVEYAKDFIDKINAWHSEEPDKLRPGQFTRTTKGIHIYDSVIVLEKGKISEPTHKQTGQPAL